MRAQSHVLGVALMLGLAVVALGALTVGIGNLVDSQAASADAQRMADGLDRAVVGTQRTGYHSHELHFSAGQLTTANRTLRVLEDGAVVTAHAVDTLVFENSEYRVRSLAGAVVRDDGYSATLVTPPPITHSEHNEILVVGVPVLNAERVSIGGTGGITRTIETNVSHDRSDLGTGEFAVAIETTTPEPFMRYFEQRGLVVEQRTFPGDDNESIVVTFSGTRQAYLIVHDLQLEVGHG
jgi:hypothetical protein